MNNEAVEHVEHEEIELLIPAYAIGAADREESERVEAHLAHCARCRALLADYNLLRDDLLYTVPPVAAPPALEERLRREITLESHPMPSSTARTARGWFAFPRLALAASAVAIVALLITNAYWLMRMRTVEERLTVQATALAMLAEAPEVRLHGDQPAPQAEGVVYLKPDANLALLRVSNLPPVPPDKAYQIWLIHDGQRDSGGLFRVDERGEAVVLITAPRPLRSYQAIGITVEPATGSPGPTGPRVIGGRFSGTF